MTDRNAMTVLVERGHDGVQPVVVIRFGAKAMRTFDAAKWAELELEARRILGVPVGA